MIDKINQIKKEALEKIPKATDSNQLQELEVKYLGRKSEIAEIMKNLKDLSVDEKRTLGPVLNEIKTEISDKIAKKRTELEKEELEKSLTTEFFDLTLPGPKRKIGHIHPLSQAQMEIEKIFSEMGFEIADGPEVESEFYNFEALNVPADHPARDMQDTFFILDKNHQDQGRLVLRTQTSPVQVRTMQKYGAPLRVIAPGKVFRNEQTDASHEHTFHQVEGLLVDKNISLAHLKGVMADFLTRLFKKEIKVRFRPGYFPFVEPGVELDFSCLLCNEKGCSACKRTGWIEFMGAGMIHPNVLKAGGVNPEEYQGWAFGFGLERLIMMKYAIDDIRWFQSGDLRFLDQF